MSKDKNEVEYEIPKVTYETPKVEYSTPKKKSKGIDAFVEELGGCWCGNNVPGCDGSGSKVTHLWGKYYNYTCPNGKNNTRVNTTIRQAAINAGLVKEENTNG